MLNLDAPRFVQDPDVTFQYRSVPQVSFINPTKFAQECSHVVFKWKNVFNLRTIILQCILIMCNIIPLLFNDYQGKAAKRSGGVCIPNQSINKINTNKDDRRNMSSFTFPQ